MKIEKSSFPMAQANHLCHLSLVGSLRALRLANCPNFHYTTRRKICQALF
jgi:hypothetical protein